VLLALPVALLPESDIWTVAEFRLRRIVAAMPAVIIANAAEHLVRTPLTAAIAAGRSALVAYSAGATPLQD
jgi:hypothetical protein